MCNIIWWAYQKIISRGPANPTSYSTVSQKSAEVYDRNNVNRALRECLRSEHSHDLLAIRGDKALVGIVTTKGEGTFHQFNSVVLVNGRSYMALYWILLKDYKVLIEPSSLDRMPVGVKAEHRDHLMDKTESLIRNSEESSVIPVMLLYQEELYEALEGLNYEEQEQFIKEYSEKKGFGDDIFPRWVNLKGGRRGFFALYQNVDLREFAIELELIRYSFQSSLSPLDFWCIVCMYSSSGNSYAGVVLREYLNNTSDTELLEHMQVSSCLPFSLIDRLIHIFNEDAALRERLFNLKLIHDECPSVVLPKFAYVINRPDFELEDKIESHDLSKDSLFKDLPSLDWEQPKNSSFDE